MEKNTPNISSSLRHSILKIPEATYAASGIKLIKTINYENGGGQRCRNQRNRWTAFVVLWSA